MLCWSNRYRRNDFQIHRVCTEWWKKGGQFYFFFFQSDCYFSWTWKSSWRSSSAIIRFFMCSTCSFSDQKKNTWKALIFLHPSSPQPKVIFYWVRLLSLTSHFRPFFVFHVGHAFYNLSLHSFCHSSMSNNRCSSEVKKKNSKQRKIIVLLIHVILQSLEKVKQLRKIC